MFNTRILGSFINFNRGVYFFMRCKYRKTCELFDEESDICTKTGGMYYDDLTVGAGCYRDLEEKNGK